MPAPAEAGCAQQLEALCEAAADANTAAYLQEVLADVLARKSRSARELRMGSWRLHGEGYAYKIPDGVHSGGRYGNAAVSLMAEETRGASFRTVITVTITAEDAELARMTPQKAQSAFSGNFKRFKLLDFTRETLCGEVCVRIASKWNDSPELLMLQRLVNMNGSCFIFTLIVANEPAQVARGLVQFEAFCSSLVFVKTPLR